MPPTTTAVLAVPRPPPPPSTAGKPASYLLVAGVDKSRNIGNMMRSAVAFGVSEVVVSGLHRVAVFGAQGTERFMPLTTFDRAPEAVAYLKAMGVRICGIELTATARPVEEHPFSGPTAFMPGNEGQGLDPFHKALCDEFVYIRHYGTGTASLNVTVATSIVLHHFGLWAGYTEVAREEGRDKYVVPSPPLPGHGDSSSHAARIRALRAAKREAAGGGGAMVAPPTWGDDCDAAVEGGDSGDAEGGT